MKKILKDYFTFSKKESVILWLLLSIILLLIITPYYCGKYANETIATDSLVKNTVVQIINNDSLILPQQPEDNYTTTTANKYIKKQPPTVVIKPFVFNPNTLNYQGFISLGLPAKTAETIIKYRNKGGKFKTPEDLKKIYTLKPEYAQQLIPFVQIEHTNSLTTKNTAYNSVPTKPTINNEVIDINTCNANTLKALPTLGNTAYTIIKFRDKLGGFLYKEQVKETYTLTDAQYNAIEPFIAIKSTQVKQLNINTANEQELAMHPYISKALAKAIVWQRSQQKTFNTIDDLKKIVFLKVDIFEKIKPYLTVK